MKRVLKALNFVRWRILSVSIFFKILGIGALVAILFGGVTLVQTRKILEQSLSRILEQNARFTGRLMATSLEPFLADGDATGIEQRLSRWIASCPELLYITVRDPQDETIGQVRAHGAPNELPFETPHPASETPRVTHTKTAYVLDARVPIRQGEAGSVELGLSLPLVSDEMDALSAILRALVLCAGVGGALALVLTRLLTRPVHELVGAADGIRAGRFESRAAIYSDDEIGGLAASFNQMAENLESYRRTVQEKEKTRVALIQKIIQTQEDERKMLSRELHDHFGQSLLALHLNVESQVDDGRLDPELGAEVQRRISELIEDIHRLVQGMRAPVLDDYGLDVALRGLVAEASPSDLTIDYHYSGSEGARRLLGPVEVTLYRIAQEALTNILRHSRASHASLIVLQKSEEVMLLVEDDGCGFDTGNPTAGERARLGIVGMKERASLLGGSCAVQSETGIGTTIRVRIPLK